MSDASSLPFSVVEVRIDEQDYFVQEDMGPLTVCITLTDANIGRNLIVILSTDDDTAMSKSATRSYIHGSIPYTIIDLNNITTH